MEQFSPYALHNAVPFEPPPGLAAMLAERDRELQQAGQQIGRLAGGIGGGMVGAVQGFKNPTAFGPDTSPASGAAQAGLMNFANAWNGGGESPGAGSMSPFARMTNPGGASATGMNFKQFAAMGKMADATYAAMSPNVPTTGDQEPSVNGVTPTQWKHLGTADKIQWFAQLKQNMDLKTAQQSYALGQQDLLERQRREQEDTAFGQALAQARKNGTPGAQPTLSDFAAVAPPEAWESPKATPFLQELAGRWRDKGAQDLRFIKSPGGADIAVGASGQFQVMPESELLTQKPNPEDIPQGYMAIQSGKGWRVIQNPAQWQEINETDPENPMRTMRSWKYIGKQSDQPPPGNVIAPSVGEVRRGYKFKGGNPADPNSWEKQ